MDILFVVSSQAQARAHVHAHYLVVYLAFCPPGVHDRSESQPLCVFMCSSHFVACVCQEG